MTRRPDGGREDPYTVIRFVLEIDGFAEVGFKKCRLGGSKTRVLTYREGADKRARRLAGATRYEAVTLERGVTVSTVLADWRRLVEHGKIDEARRSVAVVLLDERNDPGPRWQFTAAWPSRYVGPSLDAVESGVAVESLELVHEGIERVAK